MLSLSIIKEHHQLLGHSGHYQHLLLLNFLLREWEPGSADQRHVEGIQWALRGQEK